MGICRGSQIASRTSWLRPRLPQGFSAHAFSHAKQAVMTIRRGNAAHVSLRHEREERCQNETL